MIRAFLVQFSEPHEKFPLSSLSARYFMLPPRPRTERTRFCPSFVMEDGRPISNLRFFWWIFMRPPVLRCLWRESREIPMAVGAWGDGGGLPVAADRMGKQ